MHAARSGATAAGGRLPAREQWGLWGVLFCSLAGTLVALYLLTLHFQISGNPRRGLCTFTDTLSCDKVLASEYAEIAGVPVALFGVVGFALLAVMAAVLIIALFNYYISVAKDEPFKRRFLEMAGVSLGVAGLSFGAGYLMRVFLGVEV